MITSVQRILFFQPLLSVSEQNRSLFPVTRWMIDLDLRDPTYLVTFQTCTQPSRASFLLLILPIIATAGKNIWMDQFGMELWSFSTCILRVMGTVSHYFH